jgi:RNA polymerase-binding transcription factor DksA
MDGIRERLEHDLMNAVARLRQMESAVALEDTPAPVAASDSFDFDEIQEIERREIGFATRGILLERVLKLQSAIDRVRTGDYGTCVECGEGIAAARLKVLPEVETCVRCQDRLERLGRRLEAVEVDGDDEDED